MTQPKNNRQYLSKARGFDIIGDIHGYADALILLLDRLGYEQRNGCWAHPERRAIFVGDLIDRGPKQRETCEIVRAMVEGDSADLCIGNHELNAVAYSTLGANGEYLRKHTPKNIDQHASFIKEYPHNSQAHEDVITWFKSLPLWLELETFDGARAHVIHACWDQESILKLSPYLKEGERGYILGEDFNHELFISNTEAFTLVERLLKGPEMRMPNDGYFVDKGGQKRRDCRIAWWKTGNTWEEVGVFGVSQDQIFGLELSDTLPRATEFTYQGEHPVFFGHYWMKQEYGLPSAKTACTDWSIAKKGHLAAYRWDGEQVLSMDKFASVSYEEIS